MNRLNSLALDTHCVSVWARISFSIYYPEAFAHNKAHLIIVYLLHFPALYPLSNVPLPDGPAGTALPKKYILSLYPFHFLISLHLLQASKREPRLMSTAQVLDGFNAQYGHTESSAYYVPLSSGFKG
jgi:hypothetical protein